VRPDSGARPDTAAAGKVADTSRAGDSTRTRTAATPPDSSAPVSTQGAKARYRVQVAAVATPGAADDAADTAEKLGYPAVIVRERGFYKVRAGTFATRDEAQAAVKRIKSRMGGNPFVVASNP
jgi:cell division septation protein DedD